MRYIQELLGHRTSMTTEIYTHLSERNIAAMRSLLDEIMTRKVEGDEGAR